MQKYRKFRNTDPKFCGGKKKIKNTKIQKYRITEYSELHTRNSVVWAKTKKHRIAELQNCRNTENAEILVQKVQKIPIRTQTRSSVEAKNKKYRIVEGPKKS